MDYEPHSPINEDVVSPNQAREHELHEYFSPKPMATPESTPSNTILASQTLLLTHRLKAKRAVISVIDRDTQYYIAEASEEMTLQQCTDSNFALQAIWAGQSSFPKTGRFCEATLSAVPTSDGMGAYHEVCDLSSHDTFKSLCTVSGETHLRYYCGVPIRTKRGINIGAVCILDDKVRPPMPEAELNFLFSITENVMYHLETSREKVNISRITEMNQSLAAFVNPRSKRLTKTVAESASITASHEKEADSTDSQESDFAGDSRGADPSSGHLQEDKGTTDTAFQTPFPENGKADDSGPGTLTQTSSQEGATLSTTNSQEAPSTLRTSLDDDDHREVFDRASKLLARSLDLGDGGGVVFLDTVEPQPPQNGRDSPEIESVAVLASFIAKSEDPKPTRKKQRRQGMSTSPDESAVRFWPTPKYRDSATRSPVPESFHAPWRASELLRLVEKHPEGRLYSKADLVSRQSTNTYTLSPFDAADPRDFAYLTRGMPSARDILFLPFWNCHLARWSICLVYTNSKTRHLSEEIEYCYCRAFCNCVQSEINRLAIIVADQQKGAFIGSVSHELRSPLHGILAACEFLTDTECSAFQKTLVGTAESCAHTLLDTIDMILDHSKINVFSRDHNGAKKSSDEPMRGVRGPKDPNVNIYSAVDIAVIMEEVIEGVATGHSARTRSNMKFNDAGSILTKDSRFTETGSGIQGPDHVLDAAVEVILDLAPMQNWHFVTQPGAFRRVLMNLFGNSLKYTHKGHIRVALRSEAKGGTEEANAKPDDRTTLVTLIVEDTGQGIAPDYLRTKLFTAFAQENTLAAGTGLGLNLVKSIVDMLNGNIDVQSEVGVGTTITVTFPMLRASNVNSGVETPASDPSKDRDILALRDSPVRPVVTLFGQDPDHPQTDRKVWHPKLLHSLHHYLTEWYRLPTLISADVSQATDIVCIDEGHLGLIDKDPDFFPNDPILVVCCADAASSARLTGSARIPALNVLSRPFGPRKLARILCTALGSDKAPSRSSRATGSDTPAESSSSSDYGTAKGTPEMFKPDDRAPQTSEQSSPASGAPNSPSAEFPFPRMSLTPPMQEMPPSRDVLQNTWPRPSHQRHQSIATVLRSPPVISPSIFRSKSDSEAPRKDGPEPRVLLVDDNTVNLKLLSAYVSKRGLVGTMLARDGAEAVELYDVALRENRGFDIVFMDIQMPVMDGVEATKRIRKFEQQVNAASSEVQQQQQEPISALVKIKTKALIVALTGVASGKDHAQAFENGFDLYMTKPVSFKVVGNLLDDWTAEHGKDDTIR